MADQADPLEYGPTSQETEVADALHVGPEVEAFAIRLDECLFSSPAQSDPRGRALRLVNELHDYSSGRCKTIRRSLEQADRSQTRARSGHEIELDDADRSSAGPQELARWEQETHTWDLLRRLLPFRYPSPGSDPLGPARKTAKVTKTNSWHDFLESQPSVVERLAVLEWLQQTAQTGPDIDGMVRDCQRAADPTDSMSHGWLHTRSVINLRKAVVAVEGPLDYRDETVKKSHVSPTQAPLVTELDPDAATRQDRVLLSQDEAYERATWLGCFEHLRRGSGGDAIRDWCDERSEKWRAITMSAFPLQAGSATDSEPYRLLDAEALTLWRRMCFHLCRHGGRDDYERAVYGVLAGDILSVEKVCRRWDEYMFANYNALIRGQFDAYLVQNTLSQAAAAVSQSLPVSDAVQLLHGDATNIEMRLVESLDGKIETEPKRLQPFKALQAAIISRDLDRYLHDQGLVLSAHANLDKPSRLIPDAGGLASDANQAHYIDMWDHAGLRVLSHIFLIVSVLDRLGPSGAVSQSGRKELEGRRRQIQENSLVGYISFLRLAGMEDIVPLYCAVLQPPRVYEVLHANLIHLTDEASRLHQLGLLRKVSLDPVRFVTLQPQIMFDQLAEPTAGLEARFKLNIMGGRASSLKYGRLIKTDFFADNPDLIEHNDELLIRTLEWQLLVDQAWAGIFPTATRLYKHFLAIGHLNAARSLVTRMSCLELLKYRIGDIEWSMPVWFEHNELWTRQFAGVDIGEASVAQVVMHARTLWELECFVKALDSMETLASMIEMSKEDAALRRDFWVKAGSEVKIIKENMLPVLTSWLIAGVQGGDDELLLLRDTYIPETVLAYISSLHFAGTNLSRDYLMECMELAALIADKSSDLAACFTKCNRMVELIEAFASCSKALAVVSAESRSTPSSSKKMKEMGWCRDLWSVDHQPS